MLLTRSFQLGYTHDVPKTHRLFRLQLLVDCVDIICK